MLMHQCETKPSIVKGILSYKSPATSGGNKFTIFGTD